MTSESSAVAGLLAFVDASPSPWHAVANIADVLDKAGFCRLDEWEQWQLHPGAGYYVIRGGSSIVAFKVPIHAGRGSRFRIVAAHTDSPGFRIRPKPDIGGGGLLRLGVEIYGSPIIASFADRDLTLAGRIFVSDSTLSDGVRPVLFHVPRPLLRLPNAAIHLNREVNEEGLRFDRQEETSPVLGALSEGLPPAGQFLAFIAQNSGHEASAIRSWELALADSQPGALFGARQEYFATGRIDNLASCHAAMEALVQAPAPDDSIAVCALFDHEEIGSQTYQGAEGSFLEDVTTRIGRSLIDESWERRWASESVILSADMAHAFNPNYGRFYDERHVVFLNAGPVVKINSNRRYATDAWGEAYFKALCERAGVPSQTYTHRGNLPCGSTIGPITASRLGMRCIDVGNPMWAMHSARESAGARDHDYMTRAMTEFYAGTGGKRKQ